MKYLSNHEEYNSFLSAGIQEEQMPHVAYIKADNRVIYIARREPVSIAYIATGETGNVISTIEHTKWLDELGTAVGVVVIPRGILPDGKARIMGIKGVDSAGTLSDTEVTMPWGGGGRPRDQRDNGENKRCLPPVGQILHKGESS